VHDQIPVLLATGDYERGLDVAKSDLADVPGPIALPPSQTPAASLLALRHAGLRPVPDTGTILVLVHYVASYDRIRRLPGK
jgi:hypothetical protein